MFDAEPQPLEWMNDRVLWAGNNGLMLGGKFPNTKGMLGGNLGDAGWKFGGCWVETVWGSKKTAKIYKSGVCKHYIGQQHREQKSGCAVYLLGYISTHKVLSGEFLQILHLIPKYPIDIKKLKERCKGIYAFTFTMDMRCTIRSDQKMSIYLSSIWYNIDVDFVIPVILVHFTLTPSSHCSDVTWAWWRLKSPTTRLFVHASTSSTNNKALDYRPLLRRFNCEHCFPSQRTDDLDRASRPWRHRVREYAA